MRLLRPRLLAAYLLTGSIGSFAGSSSKKPALDPYRLPRPPSLEPPRFRSIWKSSIFWPFSSERRGGRSKFEMDGAYNVLLSHPSIAWQKAWHCPVVVRLSETIATPLIHARIFPGRTHLLDTTCGFGGILVIGPVAVAQRAARYSSAQAESQPLGGGVESERSHNPPVGYAREKECAWATSKAFKQNLLPHIALTVIGNLQPMFSLASVVARRPTRPILWCSVL